jgi:RHS repeat-associated protein
MQLASSTPIPDGLLATIALRNENSRLGVPSSDPALHLGQSVCKSEIVLGFKAADSMTRVGQRCTGKERDTESGNDYFGARYYASTMGRWMSPDWSAKVEPVPYAKLDDPQTLNLYSYVGNNPLTKSDPDGHFEAEWHFAITLAAGLMTGHGIVGSTKLAYQATMVDFRKGSQHADAAHTNMHAMEGRKPDGKLQNATEARQGTHDVVSNAMKTGDNGLALHAVQDLAVPLHDGHAWTGVDGSFVEHFVGDNLPSQFTVVNALVNSVQVLQGQNPVQAPAPAPAPTPAPPPPPKQKTN